MALPPGAPATVVASSDDLPALMGALLGAMIFLVFSRSTEVFRIPGLIMGLSLILVAYAALARNSTGSIWTRPTVLLILITMLMVPSSLLGLWPGGSIRMVVEAWSRSLLLYLVILLLVKSLRSLRLAALSICLACTVIVILSRTRGFEYTAESRMAISVSTLSNPNDLATILLICLPFCLWVAFGVNRRMMTRVLACITTIGSIVVIFRTGSRSGLLVMIAVGLLYMALLRGRALFLLVAAGTIATVLAAQFLPEEILRRYQTLLDKNVEEVEGSRAVAFAVGSSEGRWFLIKRAAKLSWEHPLLGVGPGMFADADAAEARALGMRAAWRQPHNSYLQVSAECGIPAGLLYLALVIWTLRVVYRARKRALRTPALGHLVEPANCLLGSTMAYAVSALFAGIAYLPYFPALIGMVAGLDHHLARSIARSELAANPKVPVAAKILSA